MDCQVITSEIDEYIDSNFKVVPGVGNVSPCCRHHCCVGFKWGVSGRL